MSVEPLELDDIQVKDKSGTPVLDNYLDLIKNVNVKLEVFVGETSMSVGDLYELKENSLIRLGREVDEPFDVVLDGNVVAKGTLAVVDDNFAIKITEIQNKKP